uniref:Uncharacterized protein n=1 Tax=Seriola dumerili TaxID=41447 RepID=A0A3B4TTN2_SERDU
MISSNQQPKIKRSMKSYFEINDNGGVTSILLLEAAKATIQGEIMESGAPRTSKLSLRIRPKSL